MGGGVGRRALAALVSGAGICGCPALGPGTASPESSPPPLVGQVFFPARRQVQASIADVAVAATVSLIDPRLNQTHATALTDERGSFSLDNLGIPTGAALYLEAVKGLSNNAIGQDAARVRTIVRFRQGTWGSLSGDGGAPVIISTSTTALSAIASLRQSSGAPVDPDRLIGSLAVGVPSGDLPDTLHEAGGVAEAEFGSARGLVAIALLADHDPLEALYYSGGAYQLKAGIAPSTGPSIRYAEPALASPGQQVVIHGAGFAAERASNTVTFSPGIGADVLEASQTRLEVKVPAGARSGEVRVAAGTEAATVSFTVVLTVDGSLDP